MTILNADQMERWKVLSTEFERRNREYLAAWADEDMDAVEEAADGLRPIVRELGELFGLPTPLPPDPI